MSPGIFVLMSRWFYIPRQECYKPLMDKQGAEIIPDVATQAAILRHILA